MLSVVVDHRVSSVSQTKHEDGEVSAGVSGALAKSGYAPLKHLKCWMKTVESLVISGEVPSFYLKQIAQEIAKRSPGVRDVTNDVRVTSER